jgi:hypothetical protein
MFSSYPEDPKGFRQTVGSPTHPSGLRWGGLTLAIALQP